MKILSIDWDYFINCSDDFRTLYFPDGGNEDIGSAMSNFIWSQRYAQNPDIEKVKVRESDIDTVKKIIDNPEHFFYFISTDSHKHLGEFLLVDSMADKVKDLEIVNIDHHHDAYNIGEKLNCGNWINKLEEAHPDVKIRWVNNCDSDKTDDPHITCVSLDSIKGETFDIVYLCRSGIWSPPHLDKQFTALNRFIAKRTMYALFREEIPNRWDEDFKKDIKTQKALLESLRSAMSNKTSD